MPLPPLPCNQCGQLMKPPPVQGNPPRANRYERCLRRCDPCGFTYSNARKNPTPIYRDYADNVPEGVHEGLVDALDQTINELSRETKKRRFGFASSEDAVTWTVFKHLHQSGNLTPTLSGCGVLPLDGGIANPAMLLWGSPMDQEVSLNLRASLVQESNHLGENPASRSEPDVMLDFGEAGLVMVEAKWGAGLENYNRELGWQRYTLGTMAFENSNEVRQSRLYQLARNWRIGWDLTQTPIRPFRLVFLVRRLVTNPRLGQYHAGLATSDSHWFMQVTWEDLIQAMSERPPWLIDFLASRHPPLHIFNGP